MKCINRHGKRLKNLRQMSRETKDWGFYAPEYVEIFYDKVQDELFSVPHFDPTHREYTDFYNPDVICIVVAHRHYSMQTISDMVDERLNPDDYLPF